MLDSNIRKIVIVGGGTAGWMTAAALSKVLGNSYTQIELVESAEIGSVGVGEATIPHLKIFNDLLGLDDDDFMKRTKATFKLGVQFVNWRSLGHTYFHGFDNVGIRFDAVPFYHYWLKAFGNDPNAQFDKCSLNAMAAERNKFMRPINTPNAPLSSIPYAYQFDAGLYAQYLRKVSEDRGVKRIEANISKVDLRETDGHIKSITTNNGETVEGDLFIDCSGFRGLLIEGALKTGYQDWTHWLPCDRAWAVPCESTQEPTPYTRSTAHTAGWQWRIPLQHRMGNGHVYCSNFMSDDEALSILLNNLDGEPIADPKHLKFCTGKRNNFWQKNCIAIGLSSGFMEPLESTSIHLIQTSITRLINLFPTMSFNEEDIKEYNKQSHREIDAIRDFLILHYHVTQRDDSPFWNYCRNMDVPEELREKIKLFQATGRIFRAPYDLFAELSWFEVMHGQGIRPASCHPLTNRVSDEVVRQRLERVRQTVEKSVDIMPSHRDYIAAHCKS